MEHRLVIIGGGFGGLYAAQSLKNAALEVTLIDCRNFHLFQPLLYQVATGWLSPANIASTLRAVLKRQKNARVLLGEAIDIDVNKRQVMLANGRVDYDTLIVATGSRHHYFGNDHWEALAPGLKTIEDATEMRRRIFLAFEAAEREADPMRVRALLTFIIVGGGPTGVELAGALGEIARDTLINDFRSIDPADARILLIEAADRTLTTYPAELFVIGDLANYRQPTGQPLPGLAPVAMQEGEYVARLLRNRLEGKTTAPFRYKDRGNMAIVGRGSAVAYIGRVQLAGFGAWLAWLFVHIVNLIEFENKILVLVQWAWYYFRRNRAARLITGDTYTRQ